MTATIAADGELAAVNSVSVGFPGNGLLAQVLVRPGDRVGAGAVLARLDDAAALEDVAAAEAALASAQSALDELTAPPTPQERAERESSEQLQHVQVDLAKSSLADTKAVAAQDAASLTGALAKARSQLQADRAALAAGEAKLAKEQAALAEELAARDHADAMSNAAAAELDRLEHAVFTTQIEQKKLQHEHVRLEDRLAIEIEAGDAEQADATRAALAEVEEGLNQLELLLAERTFALSRAEKTAAAVSAAATAAKASVTDREQQVATVEDAIVAGRDTVRAAEAAVKDAEIALAAGKAKTSQTVHGAQNAVKLAHASQQAALAALAAEAAPASPNDLSQAQAAVTAAEAQVAKAKAALADTVLRAPVSGIVAEVNGAAGEHMAGNAGALVEIVDVTALEVEATLAEADAAAVGAGDHAEIVLPALENRIVTGRVLAVDPVPSASDATAAETAHGAPEASSKSDQTTAPAPGETASTAGYVVRIVLDEIPAGALPGMTAQVEITATQTID